MAYTTLEALKDFAGFEEDDDDELLNALILSATQIIENYTDRVFKIDDETTQSFSRLRNVSTRFNGATLYFFTELADEASAITDSPTVVYLPEDGPPYYAMVITDGSWADTTVSVTGYWGHSKTVPPAVEMACIRLSKWLYDMKDTSSGNAVIITPDGQVLLPQGLPQDVVTILKPYRKVIAV